MRAAPASAAEVQLVKEPSARSYALRAHDPPKKHLYESRRCCAPERSGAQHLSPKPHWPAASAEKRFRPSDFVFSACLGFRCALRSAAAEAKQHPFACWGAKIG